MRRGRQGLILSLALAVEMGFTGLAYASTMRKQPAVRALLSIALPPVVLQLGALVGAVATSLLVALPALHTALVAFGTSALLYLVTVELLHEAHQAMDRGHIWCSAVHPTQPLPSSSSILQSSMV